MAPISSVYIYANGIGRGNFPALMFGIEGAFLLSSRRFSRVLSKLASLLWVEPLSEY